MEWLSNTEVKILRRDFLKGCLLIAGGVLGGVELIGAETLKDRAVKAVSLRIKYETLILRPPKRKGLRIWVPLPKTDHSQWVSDYLIDAPTGYSINDSGENRMLFMEVDTLKAGDRITISYDFTRRSTGMVVMDGVKPREYLEPSEWERWDSRLAEFTQQVVGSEKDPVKIARLIYDAIIKRLTYIHEVCGRGVSSIAFEEKSGRCDEFHALFRTMMMYKGIPVRWEQGMALPYPTELKKTGIIEADCINAHSWVRFYAGNGTWFPVDVSEAKRRPDLRDYYFGHLIPNRIKLSTGRGLILEPPQQGIINTFAYTYIEADGIPAIYGHNYKNTIRYEVLKVKV